MKEPEGLDTNLKCSGIPGGERKHLNHATFKVSLANDASLACLALQVICLLLDMIVFNE